MEVKLMVESKECISVKFHLLELGFKKYLLRYQIKDSKYINGQQTGKYRGLGKRKKEDCFYYFYFYASKIYD